MKALEAVLTSLANTGSVPHEYRPHALSGKWSGYLECHVRNDFLLIWLDKEEHVIKLTRLGSHAELFR